ncbi:hypothetical protein [Burkholderia ubonensis]|uniref:hypothetical protein n=1 Tax=Burkholderia ubonensis TaxID=101571 RepID=UPI00075F91DA|nr:hypothetical protein [Burkholderia ubonensis]KWI69646.1 hypothetical protein WM07_00920 [Burkholderia ubonensis]
MTQSNSRADALTDDQRQALGEAISEYFGKLDSDEGVRAPEGRILRTFDYCDSRNIDDLIDRAIVPVLATSANETGAAEAPAIPIEFSSVAETLAEGSGFWRSCSGCHETNEGYETGHYPYSKVLKCHLGGGCSECGGIGAVWDDTDYEAMGRAFEQSLAATERAGTAPAAPADERAAFEYDDVVSICDAHGICLPVECIETVVEIVKLSGLLAARAAASPAAEAVAIPVEWDQDAAIEALSDFPKGSIWYEFLEEVGFDPTSGPIYVLTVQGRAMLDQLKSAYFAAPQPTEQTTTDEANGVTLDRRDLFDFARSAIKSALVDYKAGEEMTETWYWQEATTRAEALLEAIDTKSPYIEAAPAQTDAPADAGEPIGQHDLRTSAGGRAYIAEFFVKRLRRHDFGSYIAEWLAADFACALAQYLSEHDAASRAEPCVELPCFPTMLRKMWSGGEVQRWIDDNIAPLRAGVTLDEQAWTYLHGNLGTIESAIDLAEAAGHSSQAEGLKAAEHEIRRLFKAARAGESQ